ncbi:dienelactone hydrolase family protein [Burkholderia sp. Nafp2/4-1b]|uniref:dienelactone hydrolase family protein n=1 Tax=Burkholderia sp. Nafp2/4-1b TaxID=2116686 RepID=UPI001F0967DF|nr:dienelactone hydrolase family protein [Burkholderia sp. Nafp2/4-1b]
MATHGTMVSFKRPDGRELTGYQAEPSQANSAPAVLVMQEWWGLNDQIRGVADRLASAGYLALVPDLYRGRTTVEEDEAHHLMNSLDFDEVASQDMGGALQYLETRSRRIAGMGYCMGAALTLLALCRHPALSAGVLWYGFPPLEYVDPTKIHASIIGHWAVQDAFFPLETANELEHRLHGAGVSASFHRYLAHHGFANETAVGPRRISRTQFDPVWAQKAWDRTFTFLGRTMWRYD